jgi:hypothetical protein
MICKDKPQNTIQQSVILRSMNSRLSVSIFRMKQLFYQVWHDVTSAVWDVDRDYDTRSSRSLVCNLALMKNCYFTTMYVKK